NALLAYPFCDIGYPSNVVAIEEGVPGIFISVAEINPPDIPPIYNPIKREKPTIGSIPKVIGKHNAIAIVALRPGIAPKVIPNNTPAVNISNVYKLNILENPVNNNSINCTSPLT